MLYLLGRGNLRGTVLNVSAIIGKHGRCTPWLDPLRWQHYWCMLAIREHGANE